MFKRGDEVICVDATNAPSFTEGQRYRIKSACEHWVNVDGVQYSIHPSRMRLAPPSPGQMSATPDPINPSHYQRGGVQCIDLIEAMIANMPPVTAFRLGNAVKYAWRHKEKGGTEDLRKAVWYLNREIEAQGKEQADVQVQ